MENPPNANENHNHLRMREKIATLRKMLYGKLNDRFEDVLQMTASGMTQQQIADEIGSVQQADVSRWVHTLSGERLEQMVLARKAAGMLYLDKGLAVLLDAQGKDSDAINWAKAVEVAYSKRAGLADRTLHEKYTPPPQAPTNPAVPSFTIHIIGGNTPQNGGITINQEPCQIEDADLI